MNNVGDTMTQFKKEELENAIEFVYSKILDNLATFDTLVPGPISDHYVYTPVENKDWTDGFWIGMLHLAQEYRPNKEIAEVIEKQLAGFQYRLDHEVNLNHHDVGFLYSPSAVADFRLNHTESSREMAIKAADVLMRRYLPTAKIIQAWGALNDKSQQGRMIIDCNLNLPLLYFASDQTGDNKYREAAGNHIKQAQKYLIRKDYSTYHTFHMDVDTGAPRFGSTKQGFSDDSCWARGQAWGIYGFPISYRYTGDESLVESATHLADYFLERLPEDKVCYWDLIFNDESGEPRDTSAAAIAACGLLEISMNLPISDEKRAEYEKAASEIMQSLANSYTTKNYPQSNGILTQGVYSKPGNYGVDECTMWGDYYYFEALIRMYKMWYTFW